MAGSTAPSGTRNASQVEQIANVQLQSAGGKFVTIVTVPQIEAFPLSTTRGTCLQQGRWKLTGMIHRAPAWNLF